MAKDLSREYLEETLLAARKLLPGWQYAVLHQAAKPVAGGRAAHRAPARATVSHVQSLVFAKGRFKTAADAKAWASEHGYEAAKVDETEESFRLRQEDPGGFDSFRTIEIDDGVQAIVGIKGDKRAAAEPVAKHDGLMIGLFLPGEIASRLAVEGGEAIEDLHITLAMLGDASSLPSWAHEVAARATLEALRAQGPLTGKISGVGRFDGDDTYVIHATPDVPGLSEMRERIVAVLAEAGLPVDKTHGFDPHITLAYVPKGIECALPQVDAAPLYFDRATVAIGDVRLSVPFGVPLPDVGAALERLVELSTAADFETAKVLAARAAAALTGSRTIEQVKNADRDLHPALKSAAQVTYELPANSLGVQGPVGARVLFVGAAPSELDVARGEALTGSAGKLFRETYLKALGLSRDEVAIAHVVPLALKSGDPAPLDIARWRAWLQAEIDRLQPGTVIALGQVAKSALGAAATHVLPHPRAAARRLDAGRTDSAAVQELTRKLDRIRKDLRVEKTSETGTISSTTAPIQGASSAASNPSDPGSGDATEAIEQGREVLIVKADRKEQVVLGVVLDPYIVDAHNDWAPPKQIEATAENWLTKSRVIGLNHGGQADAIPIQSYTMPYPSERDHAAAMLEQPHRVRRIKIGNQQVHSGAWLLKVKVRDAKTWADIESGKITGYSIGGFSARDRVPPEAMPRVEFIDG